jgi:phosphoglycolate phosphatase-like HAD superfamily hydrolase
MNIVFDLDHTLFNASLFKKDIFDILKESGASLEKIQDTYGEHLREVSGCYNFETHAEILEKSVSNFNKKRALEKFSQLGKSDFKKYVSLKDFAVLKSLKKQGHKLVLLTKGSKELQMQKIERSGLGIFFDKIFICQDKLLAMNKLQLDKGDFFINDHWDETKMIKEKFPDLKYFLLKRPDFEKFHVISEVDIPIILAIEKILPAANASGS